MSDNPEQLQQQIDDLERENAALRRSMQHRGVRKRSNKYLWGLPLYDIATGPDPDSGEVRGHARGIVAFGDIATGVIAFGGLARGVFAFGGLALGVVSFGGCSIGALVAMGGFALGTVAAGGAAIGAIAIGGGAFGYYAVGGGAIGEHVIDGMRRDPQAIRFFSQWIPGLAQAFPPPN